MTVRSARLLLASLLLVLPTLASSGPGRADPPSAPPSKQAAPHPAQDEATAAADAEVAAARQRFEQMQALSEEHARQTDEATRALQAKMKAAKTPEERRTIQEAFQAEQTARQEELKRKLTELQGR